MKSPDTPQMKLVRTAMAANRLNQKALAKRAGVSYNVVNRWLSGQRTPRASSLRKIETALGFSDGELETPEASDIGNLGEPVRLSTPVGEIMVYFDKNAQGEWTDTERAEFNAWVTAVVLSKVADIKGRITPGRDGKTHGQTARSDDSEPS